MTRDNPFEDLSPASLAAIYVWPGEALRFLAGESDCLHVVGDCGMGKTALLRQIELRAGHGEHQVAYACVPVGGAEPELPPEASMALLDETDRLSARGLGRLLGRLREASCRCVLAGHRRQARAIRRAGLSVAFLALEPLGEAAVQRLFEGRIAHGCGAEAPALSAEAARTLCRASRGNIERCLRIGYEIFEDLEAPRAITPDDITAAAASLDRALAIGAASR